MPNSSRKISRKVSSARRLMGSYAESNIVEVFLSILNTIKLFHWKTHQYSAHKATDELYGDLGSKIDTFVEQLMGITSKRIDVNPYHTMAINCSSLSDLIRHIRSFKTYLERMPDNVYGSTYYSRPSTQYDLLAIRDEMVGIINKFLYLGSLN